MSDEPIELKPCPCCGGKPYLANVAMAGCAYVVCTDCRLQTDDGSQDTVAGKWNARPALTVTPQEAAVPDMPETEVGEIANYYGGLWIRCSEGKPEWSIENYNGHCWEPIPTRLFLELRAISEDSHE